MGRILIAAFFALALCGFAPGGAGATAGLSRGLHGKEPVLPDAVLRKGDAMPGRLQDRGPQMYARLQVGTARLRQAVFGRLQDMRGRLQQATLVLLLSLRCRRRAAAAHGAGRWPM